MANNYQKQLDFLKKKFEIGQLGHAYLLSGKNVEEINIFAKEFIKLINGKNIAGLDTAIENGTFQDLLTIKSINSKSSVENKKDMMQITVDQIREAQNFLVFKSFYGGFSARGGSAFGGKSVIIENAERMNIEAQNCFLKNLEEPKGKTVIFLISSKPDILLPTIRSRCQEIKFYDEKKYEAEDDVNDLLKIISLDLAEKFKYTKLVNLEGDNFNKILSGLQRYFRNLLLIEIGINPTNYESNRITNYSVKKIKKILRLIDDIFYQSSIYNINNKLAMEVILLEL